jgi:methyl-accepting chemotaxis protein
MFAWLERLGLKRSIYLSFLAAVATLAVVTTLILNWMVRDILESSLRRRGETNVRALALQLETAIGAGDADLALEQLSRSFDPEDGAYAVALRPDGTELAKRLAPAMAARADAILAMHVRGVGVSREQAQAPDQAALFLGEGVLAFAATVRPLARGAPGEAQRPQGHVLIGLSTAGLDRQLNQVRLAMGLTLAGVVVFFAGLAWALSSRLLFGPIGEMRLVAQRISESDLSARASKHAEDELGSLADSLNRIGENLTVTLSRVKGVTGALGQVIERIKKTGTVVAEGVGTVSARVIDTSFSMEQMIGGLKGIADNVEVLAQSAEESSSSILEMAATNDEVAENIQSLAASVEETTAAIEQMTYSIKEVAKNVEELSATSEETSSSMNEMDVSISQVESNANETAKLSEQATRDAEMGTEALGRTLAGIDKIKASSREAAAVIEALGRKIGTVGSILGVIDEVAEQTNLLALNAAILAAQSGEHGKGFAVVADEIKDLAERTGASTKEISELVRSVQEESKNAVQAMERGVKAVEEGVRLGQEAEGTLRKIQESSRKSTQMVKAIAQATVEQSRGSKQVTMAISRIAETVQQIAAATSEQARGSEQIMKSAEKMKIITKHAERSSQEQARGSKQITKAIESISEMVNHINRAQKEQTKGSDQVVGAVVQIKQVAEAQTTSVRDLESAISDLVNQAQVLGGEVKRFKL